VGSLKQAGRVFSTDQQRHAIRILNAKPEGIIERRKPQTDRWEDGLDSDVNALVGKKVGKPSQGQTNLAESSKQGYGSKKAVSTTIKMIVSDRCQYYQH
jgi:hypothetical protein